LLDYAFSSFERVDLSPYVKPMAARISLQSGGTTVPACTLADQPLVFSACKGFQNEFRSMDLRLVVDESSLQAQPKVNAPVATAALYYRDTKLTDVTLLAQSIQVPAEAEPTAAPVSVLPVQTQEEKSSPPGERYRWLLWPVCAAVPAVILILLSKGILRKIR
jgi:hypothetical protein